jgi:hypothetical protein
MKNSDLGLAVSELADAYAAKVSKKDERSMTDYIKEYYTKDQMEHVLSVPKMVFLNGYYYAKSKAERLLPLADYLETPFQRLVKLKVYNPKTRSYFRKVDNMGEKESKTPVMRCFFAGVKAYQNSVAHEPTVAD